MYQVLTNTKNNRSSIVGPLIEKIQSDFMQLTYKATFKVPAKQGGRRVFCTRFKAALIRFCVNRMSVQLSRNPRLQHCLLTVILGEKRGALVVT